MNITDKQEEILKIIREYPGLTAKEITAETDKSLSATQSVITLLSKKNAITNKPRLEGNRKYLTYFIGSELKTEPKKQEKTVEYNPITNSLVEGLKDQVQKLRLWQERAILRYPDLKVDPIVMEARELFATHLPDQKQKDECLAGMLDKRPPMLALIEALSR